MYYGYTNFNLNRRMSQKRGAIETVIHWIGFTLKPGDPVSEKEVLQLLGMTELDRYHHPYGWEKHDGNTCGYSG